MHLMQEIDDSEKPYIEYLAGHAGAQKQPEAPPGHGSGAPYVLDVPPMERLVRSHR